MNRAGFFLLGFFTLQLYAADLSFYLGDRDYNPAIPKPAEVLGWEVGTWHVRHDQLVAYMRALDEASDRIQLMVIGHTHEQRPLLHLVISSPANLTRIDEIQQQHRAFAGGEMPDADPATQKLVIWMGYSVHGNEPSGGNASLLAAYHLAAARHIDEFLDQTVIIIDPCLNPDGFSRFAQWANMHRGNVLVADPDHREHREGWPSGRTNHYWFDLNRDWLLLQHPESRARIAQFQAWRPNILTDHHEMGTNSTFFFQPGIPSRQNPLTPARNLELTRAFAKVQADAFDDRGVLYFNEQIFDDFYYGKGSTYPDVQGSIGILFEQASSRGHLQRNSFGELTFPETIKNQFTATLSTLQAGDELRNGLLTHQRDFFPESRRLAAKDPVRAYAFTADGDAARAHEMIAVLHAHGIQVHRLAKALGSGEDRIESGFLVATGQNQYRLIKSLFEPVTRFNDDTFYDVSTWHFPSAFGMRWQALDARAWSPDLRGEVVETPTFPQGRLAETEQAYAYLLPWTDHYAPRAAYALSKSGVRVRFATKDFTAVTTAGPQTFTAGTLMVPTGVQDMEPTELRAEMSRIAREDGIDIHIATSGLTPAGYDFGSPSFAELKQPKPLILVGDGISAYDVGEIWYLLDHRYHITTTLLEHDRLNRVRLHDYTHLIMVNGRYANLPKQSADKIKNWVREGGTLITVRNATRWAVQNDFIKIRIRKSDVDADNDDPEQRPFEERSRDRALRGISGAAFRATLDPTHPLAFGFPGTEVALFRNTTLFFDPPEDPYATVAQYTQAPLISGYTSSQNLSLLKGSTAIAAKGLGRGSVILLVDPPAFRGFWHGTHRLMANSLFFSRIIPNPRRN